MDEKSQFRMESAGSLTPSLDGAPRSGLHSHRTKAKGREHAHEARQPEKGVLLQNLEQKR